MRWCTHVLTTVREFSDDPCSIYSTVSLDARDLVGQMLERDPKKRISARDALQHPWIVNRVTPADEKKSGISSLLDGAKVAESGHQTAEEEMPCTIS